MKVSLEKMVKKTTKNMVISDLHGQHVDDKALALAMGYAQDYKPDNLYINGDLVDFYSISRFDKNPKRKEKLQDEIENAEGLIQYIRKTVGDKTAIVYLSGNHEDRLQRFVWSNPELEGLSALDLRNLLNLKQYKVKFVGVDRDYWKNDNGHEKQGDMLIMHGDNTLNGASTSKYSGYSAKNTMMTLQNSVTMGHTHRLAQVYHSSPDRDLVGLESGCLCKPTGTANWQQGFVTFETSRGKTVNPKIHKILKGKLYEDGVVYE